MTVATAIDQGTAPAPDAVLLENGPLRVRHCRYGLMLYNVNDIYVGRSFDRYGEYCEQEVALYRQVVKPGQVIVDGGANIGAHTVFFGRTVQHQGTVLAFEPQRFVHHMLCANLALNGLANVKTWQAAVGAQQGFIKVPPMDYGKAGNFGGLSLREEGEGESVPVIPLDSLQLGRCDLIKLDVQGMERAALEGARQTVERLQPVLYVENDVEENSPALIQWLLERDYRVYWHIPRLFQSDNFRNNAENVFGITVNVNLLCLPARDQRKVDLRRVESPDEWWKRLQ